MADNVDENGNDEVPTYLRLRVIASDGGEVHFRIKHTTSMGKLKRSYAERVGVSTSTIYFIYNKRRIDDEDTAHGLGMKDYDVITVHPVASGPVCQDCLAHFAQGDDDDEEGDGDGKEGET